MHLLKPLQFCFVKNFELLPKVASPPELITEVRRGPSGASVELNVGGKPERIQVFKGPIIVQQDCCTIHVSPMNVCNVCCCICLAEHNI